MAKNMDLEIFINKALEVFRMAAPHRTGWLKQNIKYEITDVGFNIIVDEKDVPYIHATTDAWVSPKWNGRANPNENWQMEAGELFVNIIKQMLNGRVIGINENDRLSENNNENSE